MANQEQDAETVQPSPEPDEVEEPDEVDEDGPDPVDDIESIELPEPEESEWDEGTSPYDDEEITEQDVVEEDAPRILSLASFVRSGAAAVRWALNTTSYHPQGMCQQFVRMTFNVGSGFPSAAAAWHGADKRHPTNDTESVPAGVPVYWLGGSRGFGHAAVSIGRGLCRSTDWPSATRVGTARIADIERVWGQNFVGWTEDINNVTVWEKPTPTLDASWVARRARRKKPIRRGRMLKRAVASEVGAGRMSTKTRKLGDNFRDRYRLVQIKYLKALGRRPTDAATNGIPGPASLEWLGRRHGFRVRP